MKNKKEIQRPGDLAPCGFRTTYGHNHNPDHARLQVWKSMEEIKQNQKYPKT